MSWSYEVDGAEITLYWEDNAVLSETADSGRIKRDLSGIPTDPDLKAMAYEAIEETEENWQSAEATRKAALAGLDQFEEH